MFQILIFQDRFTINVIKALNLDKSQIPLLQLQEQKCFLHINEFVKYTDFLGFYLILKNILIFTFNK